MRFAIGVPWFDNAAQDIYIGPQVFQKCQKLSQSLRRKWSSLQLLDSEMANNEYLSNADTGDILCSSVSSWTSKSGSEMFSVLAIPKVTAARALSPWGMSCSFHTLSLFRSCRRNAQHITGRDTGHCLHDPHSVLKIFLKILFVSDAKFWGSTCPKVSVTPEVWIGRWLSVLV